MTDMDYDAIMPITSGLMTDVKPALVTDKTKRRSKKQAPHLKWDEKAIEEHDQLRGTRMKIDEPNTPYTHYDSGSETDGSASRCPKSPIIATGDNNQHQLQWDHLERKLDSVAAVRDAYPSSPSSHGDNAHDPEERKAEMKALEFKDHRKRHYNEMELVRQFRKEHPDIAEPMEANGNNNNNNEEEENHDNDADDEDENE